MRPPPGPDADAEMRRLIRLVNQRGGGVHRGRSRARALTHVPRRGHDGTCVWGAVSGCAGCVVSVSWVCMCVTIAMAGWLHGVCVGACRVVSPRCGFSLALFCNFPRRGVCAYDHVRACASTSALHVALTSHVVDEARTLRSLSRTRDCGRDHAEVRCVPVQTKHVNHGGDAVLAAVDALRQRFALLHHQRRGHGAAICMWILIEAGLVVNDINDHGHERCRPRVRGEPPNANTWRLEKSVIA